MEKSEMMKFDKSKILTVVTADQAKVGQKGWVADNLMDLFRRVSECHPITIASITGESMEKRFISDANIYALFYPAPEPSYRPFNNNEPKVGGGGRMREIKGIAMKILDIPIGTKVKFKGTHGVCEEYAYGDCCKCILNNTPLCATVSVPCEAWYRADYKEVYFREVKEAKDD